MTDSEIIKRIEGVISDALAVQDDLLGDLFDLVINHYREAASTAETLAKRLTASGIPADAWEQVNKLDRRVRELEADNDRLLSRVQELESPV